MTRARDRTVHSPPGFQKRPRNLPPQKGPSPRGLSLCTCLAISSLPVPVSPVTSTFAVLGPIKCIRSSSALDLTSSNTRADALRLKGATGGAGKLRSGLGTGDSDIKPYYIHRHNRILRRPCQGNRNLGQPQEHLKTGSRFGSPQPIPRTPPRLDCAYFGFSEGAMST